MKSVRKFFLFLLMGTMVTAMSCNKDEDTIADPQVSLTVSPNEGAVGDDIQVSIVASADPSRNLKKLVVEAIYSNPVGSSKIVDSTFKKNNIGYTFSYTIPAGYTGTIQLKATATDDAGINGQATANVTIKASSSGISSYSTVLLAAPLSDKNSKTFFASENGKTYSLNEADASSSIQTLIDFGYHYGTSGKATISAPSAYTAYPLGWSVKNATKLSMASISASDFDAINDEAGITAVSVGSSNKVDNLAVGNVVSFKTVSGKMGVFKVTELKAGSGGGDYIKIDVKVQK